MYVCVCVCVCVCVRACVCVCPFPIENLPGGFLLYFLIELYVTFYEAANRENLKPLHAMIRGHQPP